MKKKDLGRSKTAAPSANKDADAKTDAASKSPEPGNPKSSAPKESASITETPASDTAESKKTPGQTPKAKTPHKGPGKKPGVKTGVKTEFTQKALGFAKSPSGLTAGGLGIALLGTTALATGVLPLMAAAGVASVGALISLIGSSDIVVNNAEKIGERLNMSPILIGTIAGIITSLPELFVSGISALKGSPEIGIGNILGSNVANIMLILGTTALYKGISNKGLNWKFNAAVMGAATAGFTGLLLAGVFNPVVGGIMIGLTAAYTVASYLKDKKSQGQNLGQNLDKDALKEITQTAQDVAAKAVEKIKQPLWKMAAMGAAGIGALILSADLLVNNASQLAMGAGVSAALVSLVGVAIGTSLPELMVSLNAAKKGNPGLAIGNVLGSNIFNILMVGGFTALFAGGMPPEFTPATPMGWLNIGALAGSAIWGVHALRNGGGFSRKEGAISLIAYAGFVAASFLLAPKIAPDADVANALMPEQPAAELVVEAEDTHITTLQDGTQIIDAASLSGNSGSILSPAANENFGITHFELTTEPFELADEWPETEDTENSIEIAQPAKLVQPAHP